MDKKFNSLKIAVLLLLVVVSSIAVLFLWNWLMPTLFGLTTISIWQAVGIYLLSRLLFGRNLLHTIGVHKQRQHRRHNTIHEKWNKMTSEQRQEFINQRRKHGRGHKRAHFHEVTNENQDNNE